MILVVAGHVVSYNPHPHNNLIFNFCYSFHMFLFMFISGYLIAHRENTFSWLKHRFRRIMIPFFVWSGIAIVILDTDILSGIYEMIVGTNIWYLKILFLCDIVLCITRNLKYKLRKLMTDDKKIDLYIFIFIFLLFNFVAYRAQNSICDAIKMLVIYYPFYFSGWYAARYKIKMKDMIYKASVIIYPISMIFYGYKEGRAEKFLVFKKALLEVGISSVNIQKIEHLYLGALGKIYTHFVVAPIGCIFAWWGIEQICKIDFVKKITSVIGFYSMQVYLMSGYLQFKYTNIYYYDEVISLVLGLVIPVIAGKIIEKHNFISGMLFGK